MMVRRLVAGAAIAGMALIMAALPAAAEKEPFQATCNGVTYTLTSGNGEWAAAQSVDHRTHFIPKAFTFTVVDENGNVVFQESVSKKGHRNQETVTCTFSDTFTEDGQTFTFSGTATVVQRPPR